MFRKLGFIILSLTIMLFSITEYAAAKNVPPSCRGGEAPVLSRPMMQCTLQVTSNVEPFSMNVTLQCGCRGEIFGSSFTGDSAIPDWPVYPADDPRGGLVGDKIPFVDLIGSDFENVDFNIFISSDADNVPDCMPPGGAGVNVTGVMGFKNDGTIITYRARVMWWVCPSQI